MLRLTSLITGRRLWMAICSVWVVLIAYGLITVFGSRLVMVEDAQWCEIALAGLSAETSSLLTSLVFVDLPIAGLIAFYGIICVKLWKSVQTHRLLQANRAKHEPKKNSVSNFELTCRKRSAQVDSMRVNKGQLEPAECTNMLLPGTAQQARYVQRSMT